MKTIIIGSFIGMCLFVVVFLVLLIGICSIVDLFVKDNGGTLNPSLLNEEHHNK